MIKTHSNNYNNQKHSLLINGKFTSDSKIVANSINQYFTSIAQKLAEKMKPSTTYFMGFCQITSKLCCLFREWI